MDGCLENGKNVKKKKGLFGEALFLTTSHFEVLVIDNKSIIYDPPPPPFVNPGSTTGHSDIVDLWKTVVSEWDEQYTSAEDIVQEQPYMCRGCFSAYSRFIAMKTKITTNIAEAMRCFSIVSSKKQRLESPYTASELSLICPLVH